MTAFNADLNVTIEMNNAQRVALLACVTACLDTPDFVGDDANDLAELVALRDMLAAIPTMPDANDCIHNFTL